MPSIPQYLIETFLCLVVFYTYYRLFLQRSGMYFENRVYLLATPFLALIIPGLSLDFLLEHGSILKGQSSPFDLAALENLTQSRNNFRLEIVDILMVIYLLINGYLGFQFLDKFWNLVLELKIKRRLTHFENWNVNDFFPKHSFFALAYWTNLPLNEKKELTADYPIFKINEKHGLDVLLMELLNIFCWFNPMIFLIKKEIKELHENNFLERQAAVNNILFHKEVTKSFEKTTRNDKLLKLKNWTKLIGVLPLILALLSCFSFNLINETPLQTPLSNTYEALQKFSRIALLDTHPESPEKDRILWGNQEIGLQKIASPNGYSGEIEVEMEEFQKLLNHPIQVFNGKEEKEFLSMDLHLEVLEEKGSLWFANEKNGAFELEHRRLGNFKKRILPGDILTFTGMAEDMYLAGVSVKIKNPMSMYRPEIKVKHISKSPPAFGFQIINRTNKKALLKIDTNNIVTRHILDLYAQNDQFEIVHVPNFQTNERFINAYDNLFSKLNIYENYLSVARFDKHFLPEFQQFQNQIVELNWGELVANPSSENYTVADFRQNYQQPIILKIGDDHLKIESFRLIHKPKNIEAVAYHSANIQDDFFKHFLRKTNQETSIYFDEIIVQKFGRYYYLPIDFVFNIGKNRDKYTLEVEKATGNGPRYSEKRDGFLQYNHYRMSELIAVLTGDERIEFEIPENDPVLDITFYSEYLSTRQSEKLILKKLYQQYYFSSTIRFENRSIWVIHPPKQTEKIDAVRHKIDNQRILEKKELDSSIVRHPQNLDEIALAIENKFDFIVFNETNLEKTYNFELDWSSFDSLKSQLETDYGFRMTQEERVLKIVKIEDPKY